MVTGGFGLIAGVVTDGAIRDTMRANAAHALQDCETIQQITHYMRPVPVTEDDLALLAQRVEETIRSQGSAEIDAHEVGLAVLEPQVARLGRALEIERARERVRAAEFTGRLAPEAARALLRNLADLADDDAASPTNG